MDRELLDLPIDKDWEIIKRIEKGWSKDIKFYIQDKSGAEYLLRISDAKFEEDKCKEFKMIKQMNTLKFPMSRAIDFGKCKDGQSVFMLLTWVQGEALDEVIETLTPEEQYVLGVEAGQILKQIHHLPVAECEREKVCSKKEIMFQKLKRYEGCAYRVAGDESVLSFIKQNINQIEIQKPVYTHGDFHIGNLILTPEQHVGVIDFNRWRYGDPYEEFYKIQAFDRELSIPFARGKIQGYFAGEPPEDFWHALAVYNAYASLYSVVWAIPFGEKDVEGMVKRRQLALEDYDNFDRIIPKWYDR